MLLHHPYFLAMCDSINEADGEILESNELCTKKSHPWPCTTISNLADMSFLAIYPFLLVPYMARLHWCRWLYLFFGFEQNWVVYSSH